MHWNKFPGGNIRSCGIGGSPSFVVLHCTGRLPEHNGSTAVNRGIRN
jgi:hypothetical protein